MNAAFTTLKGPLRRTFCVLRMAVNAGRRWSSTAGLNDSARFFFDGKGTGFAIGEGGSGAPNAERRERMETIPTFSALPHVGRNLY